MASMDVFNGDAFNMVTLTDALDKMPYKPGLLGSLNIFEPRPVRTVTVAVEKRDGVLSLIQTSARGAPPAELANNKRDIRDFRTSRIAKVDTLMADELQNIRAFGSETELMQVQQEVSRRMARLRDDVELTHENMRLGAIQGIVTDADASIIYNWYTQWGIAQAAEIDFALTTATTDVRGKCTQVARQMMKAAKGAWVPGTEIHALASDEFYDALTSHALVRDTYLNWSASADLRQGLAYSAFTFGGITFHNYRGTDDGSTVAVAANKCKFFPVGAPGVFQVAWSPAETFNFVNQPGQPVYAMTIPDRDRNAWVKTEVYSYPLFMCTRPEMLQRAKKA